MKQQVAIDSELKRWIEQEAKRQKRTVKGEVEYLLELAKARVERENDIEDGMSQIDTEALRRMKGEG
jgi:hypothetical protein